MTKNKVLATKAYDNKTNQDKLSDSGNNGRW